MSEPFVKDQAHRERIEKGEAILPSYPVTKELVDAALRHADGLTALLAKSDWKPGRAHIEQARNSIKKLADMLGTAQRQPDPGDSVREALEHAKARFECLAEDFEKAGDTVQWAMCSVDAERMARATSPVSSTERKCSYPKCDCGDGLQVCPEAKQNV